MAYKKIETQPLNVWKPELGEILEGKVTAINPNGKYGIDYTVTGIIAGTKKEITVTLPAHKVLQSLLKEAQLKVADKIRVTFTEIRKLENGTAQFYDLEVDR